MNERDGTRVCSVEERDPGAYESHFRKKGIQVSEAVEAKILCSRWKVCRMACKCLNEHKVETWRAMKNLMVIRKARVCLESEERVPLIEKKGFKREARSLGSVSRPPPCSSGLIRLP